MKSTPSISIQKFWIAMVLLAASVICSLGLLLMGGKVSFFAGMLVLQTIIFWQILRSRPEQYR